MAGQIGTHIPIYKNDTQFKVQVNTYTLYMYKYNNNNKNMDAHMYIRM